MKPRQNFNHPSVGASIAAEPITDINAIATIKQRLAAHPRDLALFTLGINTNLRISDLLRLTIGQVYCLKPGDQITVKQQKRGKYGIRVINAEAVRALHNWFDRHPDLDAESPVFCGKDPSKPITKQYASRLVKRWCRNAGLRGRFSAHTLRKTFGFHALNTFKQPLHFVQAAYGHRDSGTTLAYLGIQPQDISNLFMNEL